MLSNVTFSIFVYALRRKVSETAPKSDFRLPFKDWGLDTSLIVIRDADFQPVAASPRVSPLHCPTHNRPFSR